MKGNLKIEREAKKRKMHQILVHFLGAIFAIKLENREFFFFFLPKFWQQTSLMPNTYHHHPESKKRESAGVPEQPIKQAT